jgi:hypothetical protein
MVIEFLAKQYLNSKFGRFGRMLDLKVDSKEKTIRAEVLLKGEKEPIEIRIGHYEVRTEGSSGLALSSIKTSRPWIDEVIALKGPEIFIPIEKVGMLSMFL